MTIRRLLLAVALPVLAASTAHGQTIFNAAGGDVTFTPVGLDAAPFQIYLDAIGYAHHLIASSDGTSFTLDTRGSVAISSFNTLGSLDLGNFAAGAGLVFTFAINGRTYNAVDFYLHKQGGYDFQLADIDNNSSNRVSLQIRGIASATGLQCPGGDRLAVCSDVIPTVPVTGTPEPGTWALMATGLAGLIPVVRRRRARA